MLSPSACRMGLATTSRRKIGTEIFNRSSLGSSHRSLSTLKSAFSSSPSSSSPLASFLIFKKRDYSWVPRRLSRPFLSTTNNRWKSTAAAAYDSDSDGNDDDLDTRSKRFATAAQLRTTSGKLSHEEAWMINLGRGNDDEWLTGPREEDWFTGIHPRVCPGTVSSFPLLDTLHTNESCISFFFLNGGRKKALIAPFFGFKKAYTSPFLLFKNHRYRPSRKNTLASSSQPFCRDTKSGKGVL